MTQDLWAVCSWSGQVQASSYGLHVYTDRDYAEYARTSLAHPERYVVVRFERDDADVPTTPKLDSGEIEAVRA